MIPISIRFTGTRASMRLSGARNGVVLLANRDVRLDEQWGDLFYIGLLLSFEPIKIIFMLNF
jgi:hypothetical protein